MPSSMYLAPDHADLVETSISYWRSIMSSTPHRRRVQCAAISRINPQGCPPAYPMTQDFAKKPRHQRQPQRQKKAKSGPARAAPRSNIPGWVWLFTGTVLGAFIMFLTYLSDLTPPPSVSESKQAVNDPAPKATDKAAPKPRFDFYKLLKESEVVVPQDNDIAATNQPAERLEYLLQVASFKNAADADRLRAELILLNLEAKAEKVQVRNGETWHRVMVGPFTNRSKMAKARSILASRDLNALLLKRKIQG